MLSALDIMQKEDPSLTVTTDEDSGQLLMHGRLFYVAHYANLLLGMGELHLEIVRSRLLSQHKVKVEAGRTQIHLRAYF